MVALAAFTMASTACFVMSPSTTSTRFEIMSLLITFSHPPLVAHAIVQLMPQFGKHSEVRSEVHLPVALSRAPPYNRSDNETPLCPSVRPVGGQCPLVPAF